MAEGSAASPRQNSLARRRQHAVERILEDESLTAGLTDIPARVLLDWAVAQVTTLAERPDISDEALRTGSQAIRGIVRDLARSGTTDPAQLEALASRHLAARAASGTPSALALAGPAAELAPAAEPVAASELPAANLKPLAPLILPHHDAPSAEPPAPRPTLDATLHVQPAQPAPLPASWTDRLRAWLRKGR